jgi:hypothetical protein
MRLLLTTAFASALAFPFGALVQRWVSFDIVSLEGMGLWVWLAWPLVVFGMGLAAVWIVAKPVGLVLQDRPADRRVNLALRSSVEAVLGTVLFRLVSFPISWGETALLLVPQVVFFGAFHVLHAEGSTTRSPGTSQGVTS